MTIGIGVLGTSEEGRNASRIPDTAILLADTMGSYEDADSHSRLHKTLMFPEDRVYAVAAGDVTCAAQLLPCICTFLREIPKGGRTFGKIRQALCDGCFEFRHHLFTLNELPKHRLAPHLFNPNQQLDPKLNKLIQKEWLKFDSKCDVIMAIFDDNGVAYLFEANGNEHVIHVRNFPGFAAIGTGLTNAQFWLSRRTHTLGMNPLRAAYHAFEAKLTAEGSAHVNEHLDMIVATGTRHWFSSTHKTEVGDEEHPEINISKLKEMLATYWIKRTDDIGFKQSASQMSARAQ